MSRRLEMAVLVALVALVSACGSSSTSAAQTASSPSPAAASTPSANQNQGGGGQLDPAVSLPSGFPSGIPVYPGARLTASTSFAGGGSSTFGLEWETLDSASQVQAYYASHLNQGDWSVTYSVNSNGTYGVGFTSKSKPGTTGILAVTSGSGVTKIALSFVTTG
jgi:hypothetical protein